MPLKILKFESAGARLVLIAVAVLFVAAGWLFAKWNFANLIASRIDIELPESRQVVDWLIKIAPDDPQPHFAAARLYESTFDPDDLTRSLHEYESAVALAPNNFLIWLDLGKSRDRNGDAAGAEAAFRRALELAPNYSSVQWALGNSLLRHGNSAEGFAFISKAAESDRQYSNPAASLAWQLFNGDIGQVRRVLGDSAVTNAALANLLAEQTRFADAFEAWSTLSADDKKSKFKELGEKLAGQFAVAKKFQLVAKVERDIRPDEFAMPVIGQISNGGFENGVKLRNAGNFEWQIADGAAPQINLSDGQKHSGKYGLLMVFDTFDPAAFRSISQTVLVVPSAAYEFEVFYRSDVKTNASFKWEVADAGTGAAVALTEPLVPTGEWASAKTRFNVPASSDAVIIRFVRTGCGSVACPVNGKFFFDDLAIRRL